MRQGQPGGARRRQRPLGAARRRQGQPGDARRRQVAPAAARGHQGPPGAARKRQEPHLSLVSITRFEIIIDVRLSLVSRTRSTSPAAPSSSSPFRHQHLCKAFIGFDNSL